MSSLGQNIFPSENKRVTMKAIIYVCPHFLCFMIFQNKTVSWDNLKLMK